MPPVCQPLHSCMMLISLLHAWLFVLALVTVCRNDSLAVACSLESFNEIINTLSITSVYWFHVLPFLVCFMLDALIHPAPEA